MPPPSAANRPNVQDATYAEEAARVHQRHLDMAAEITRLTIELEEWRRRALAAEEDVKRGERRELTLQSQVDTRNTQLTQERDLFKETVVKLSTQFGTAASIILDAHKLMDEVLGQKPKVNLESLANEIDRSAVEKAWSENPTAPHLTITRES